MSAFTFLAVKRMNREAHGNLSVMALANSGDGKEINKQLAHWEKDADL
jgi:hypothetical protein